MLLRESAMMQNIMDGGMMWGTGIGGLIADPAGPDNCCARQIRFL
jgi:hypothetical protein